MKRLLFAILFLAFDVSQAADQVQVIINGVQVYSTGAPPPPPPLLVCTPPQVLQGNVCVTPAPVPAGCAPNEVYGVGYDRGLSLLEQALWPAGQRDLSASGDLGTAIMFVANNVRYP